MRNLAGSFKLLLVAVMCSQAVNAWAASSNSVQSSASPSIATDWFNISKKMEAEKERDRRDGLSYVISGSLGLAGGIAGALVAQDEIERGIYSIFQTIGVASIGYGAYTWVVGNEEREFYDVLEASNLTPAQKLSLIDVHQRVRKDREKREHLVKAITHGLIAGLNIYNAQQQQNSTLKTGLLFIGGVNLLACVSYSFEF